MPSASPAQRDVASRALLLVATWTGLTVVLFGAGELVTHWSVMGQFDRHVTAWVVAHRSHTLDAMMRAVTWCGTWVAVAVTGGLLLVLTLAGKLPPVVVILGAAGWAGEVTSVNLVKHLVGRHRPPQTIWLVTAHGASFPSGHAANAALVFGTLGFVWWILTDSMGARMTGTVLSVLGVLTVGFSRVELGVHWTTDVVAGSLAVGAWMVGIGLLFASRFPAPVRHRRVTLGHLTADRRGRRLLQLEAQREGRVPTGVRSPRTDDQGRPGTIDPDRTGTRTVSEPGGIAPSIRGESPSTTTSRRRPSGR